MSEQTYRSEINTPRFLFDMRYARRIEKECGTTGVGLMVSYLARYFLRESSRETILAEIENPAVRVAFEKYCDEMDEEDVKWAARRKNASGPEEKTSKQTAAPEKSPHQPGRSFRPPQTEAERQNFLLDVEAFAAESGFVGFDAEAFVHSLEIRGWKTFRGVTVVCWKQAARKWHLAKAHAGSDASAPEEKVEMADSAASDAAAEETMPAAGSSASAPAAACTEDLLHPSLPGRPEVAAAAESSAAGAKDEASSSLPHAVLSASGLVVGSDIESLSRCIQANDGRMYPGDYQKLLGFTELFPEEMICRAADLAAENAAYNRARYICTVLQNWDKERKYSPSSLTDSRADFYSQRPAPPPSYTDERARETVMELMARYGVMDSEQTETGNRSERMV